MLLSRYARICAVIGDLCLIASLIGWHGWLAPTHPGVVLALCAPLLLPLPGLIRGTPYTYAWASLLVLAYLAYGLTEFLASAAQPAITPMLFASAVMFAGCVMYVRLRARETAAG